MTILEDVAMWAAIQTAAGKIVKSMQGKKRWLTLAAYALMIAGTLSGLPVDDLLGSMMGDPGFTEKGTVATLLGAGLLQFRFFQNLGTNRELRERVTRLGG